MSKYRIVKKCIGGSDGYWIQKRVFFRWWIMGLLQDGDYWDFQFAIPKLEEAEKRLAAHIAKEEAERRPDFVVKEIDVS